MKMIQLTTDFSTNPIFINAELILFFSPYPENKSKTKITFLNNDVLLTNISCDKLVELLGLKRDN